MSEDIQAIKKISNQIITKVSGILEREKILFDRNEAQEELLELVSQKLTSIENNFEELTKSLAQGSYPVKLAKAIAITDSLVIPKISAIEISTDKLVEVYNEAVNLLSGYAIKVSLTAESYREPNSSEIILETGDRGNYWVIATIEQKEQKYLLVPNGKITLNIHKLKTIQTLFQLEGESSSSEAEFYLQKPAILSLLPNGKQWRLEEQGILVFGKYSKLSENISDRSFVENNKQMSSTVEKLLSNQQTLTSTVEQLITKVSQVQAELYKVQQDHDREKKDWVAQTEELQHKIQEVVRSPKQQANSFVEQTLQEGKQKINSFFQTTGQEVKQKTQSSVDRNIKTINNLSQFLSDYERDKKFILERIVSKVTISLESFEKIIYYGDRSMVTLHTSFDGNYWIIDYSGTYYLVPQDNIKIDRKNLNVILALFAFDPVKDYKDNRNIQLIQPAKVSKLSSKQWKLEERGQLKFS